MLGLGAGPQAAAAELDTLHLLLLLLVYRRPVAGGRGQHGEDAAGEKKIGPGVHSRDLG